MDGQRREQLWRVIAERAVVPNEDGWAQVVSTACVAALPGVDAMIVTLRGNGRAVEIIGASDSLAEGVAEHQYTVGEGPGIEAFTTRGPVLVADLTAEQGRWPAFAGAALGVGAVAVLAFPLQVGGINLGTVEYLCRRSGGLAQQVVNDAALVAELITTALLRRADAAEQAGREFAPRPVTSFRDVNVATGMLAAQLRISLDDAFARLRGRAFSQGRSVVELARDVLEHRVPLDEFAE